MRIICVISATLERSAAWFVKGCRGTQAANQKDEQLLSQPRVSKTSSDAEYK